MAVLTRREITATKLRERGVSPAYKPAPPGRQRSRVLWQRRFFGQCAQGLDLGVSGGVPHFNNLAPGRFFVRVDLQDDKADRKSTRLNSSHRTISYAVF